MQEETNTSANDEGKTAGDAVHGDGTVADEDVDRAGEGAGSPPAGGQDHSTENYGGSMPDGGVGGVQESSEAGSDIADINQ